MSIKKEFEGLYETEYVSLLAVLYYAIVTSSLSAFFVIILFLFIVNFLSLLFIHLSVYLLPKTRILTSGASILGATNTEC